MSDFKDKYGPWAVVTGASSGIGVEIAKQVAARGLNIVLVARRERNTTQVSDSIRSKYGVETKVLLADLSNSKEVENILTQTEDMDVGLLVNNAAQVTHGSFFRTDLPSHLNIVEVNARAALVLSHGFGRRLLNRRKGGMIFVSSTAHIAMPWVATYSATKGFLSNLAYLLRHELEPHGINVLAVEPGLVRTEMTENDFMKLSPPHSMPDYVAAEAIAAFENNVLRITPGVAPDEKADATLTASIDSMSDKMKKVWDPELFEPNY